MEYKFKVGVSLRFGELPATDENLQALIKSNMKHVEIAYVEYCNAPEWTTTVRNMLNASPVNINSIHAPFSKEVDISRLDDGGQEFAIEQISKAIKMAERLGAGIVVLHGSSEPISQDERDKRVAQSRSSIHILSKKAQESGVKLALELLPRTCLGNTADELELLLANIPSEYAGFCLDSNHPANPKDLPAIVKQLSKKLITLHISDYDGIDEKHWMPFIGVIDWPGYANALRDIGYGGAFIYEANIDGDTMEMKLKNVWANFQRIVSA